MLLCGFFPEKNIMNVGGNALNGDILSAMKAGSQSRSHYFVPCRRFLNRKCNGNILTNYFG